MGDDRPSESWWLQDVCRCVEALRLKPGYGSVRIEIRKGEVEFVEWSGRLLREKAIDKPLL